MNDDAQFLELFRALDEPFAELRRRLAALEKKPARAEVAGAVEVVASLPPAGQPGRLLYQSADPAGLYADNGAGWDGPLRGGGLLARAEYALTSSYTLSTSDWVFVPVNPTAWYLDVVAPAVPFEVVVTCNVTRDTASNRDGYLDIGYDDGAGGYVRAGHPDFGLARVPRGVNMQFHLASLWEGLTPGQTYRFYLMTSASTYDHTWQADQLVRFWARTL